MSSEANDFQDYPASLLDSDILIRSIKDPDSKDMPSIHLVPENRLGPVKFNYKSLVYRGHYRVDDELKSKFVENAPAGFVTMQEATRILGVSRQTVLQRVKLGKLEAVHIYQGRRKGLRIKALDNTPTLFNHLSSTGVQYEA